MASNLSPTRRAVLAGAQAALVAGPAVASAGRTFNFPDGFLWGAAISGHQAEGNDVNSDFWLLEHLKPSIFAEPSGDACDHYNRFEEDIAILAALGLNSFRFSIEWSRIEPAQGEFSTVELEHYRRVAASCRSHGVRTALTYNHFSVPEWFASRGGWEQPDSPDLFARYCAFVTRGVGEFATIASTLNEPNAGLFIRWAKSPPGVVEGLHQVLAQADRATGSDRFSSLLFGNQAAIQPNLLAAHRKGYEAIKSAPYDFPVGVSLAILDDQAVGPDSRRDAKRIDVYEPWLEAAKASDFVGVQTYTRSRLDKAGALAPPPGAELTQTGDEFWPQALEGTIRYAFARTQKPIYVTENGIATEDDTRRVAYIRQALEGVAGCLRDGLPVRGYMHWSLLDNYEWIYGFGPKFGLIAVDRTAQRRHVKPSAVYLGEIARTNTLKEIWEK